MNTYVSPEPNAPQTAPLPPKVPAGLAISALVVGIIAFLSGWVPVWGLLAGIAALVLGILALRKGQSKGMAIPGIILGGIATLTSLITTIVMIVGLASSNVIITTPDSDRPTSGNSEPSTPDEPSAKTGTRENPAPLGSRISSNDWTVVVNSFNPDGNSIVADSNMFNEEPKEGFHYVIVNYTVTYAGSDSASAFQVSIDLVTSTGEVVTSSDSLAVLDDSLGFDELYNGGSATGSEPFLVKDGSSQVIRVTPGFFADESFVATQ